MRDRMIRLIPAFVLRWFASYETWDVGEPCNWASLELDRRACGHP